MLGLGLALTNFGSKGGISDIADGSADGAIIALNPVAWFDSSYSASMWQDTSKTVQAGVGNPVKVWQSRVGALEASTAVDANRPIVAADGLVFDGSGDVLAIGSTAFTVGITVFAVAKLSGAGSFPEVLSLNGSGNYVELRCVASTGRPSFAGTSTNVGAGASATSTPAGSTSSIVGSTLVVLTGTGTQPDANSTTRVWQGTSLADTRLLAGLISTTAAPMYIGGRSASNYFPGTIAELLIFASLLSDDNILAVQQYLAAKWGL